MDSLPEIEISWQRPHGVVHPHVWHRFETKPQNGETHKIRIEDLTEDRYEEAMEFMMKYYLHEEPLCVSSKLVGDEISFMIYQYLLTRIMAQNVSVIAVIDNNLPKPEIVALELLTVVTKSDNTLPESPGKAVGKLRKIYYDIRQNCNPHEILGADAYLQDWGLCITASFRRLGIASNMLNALTSVAKGYDLKAAIILFTQNEAQKLAEKAGFEVYNEIVYENYKDDKGKAYFPIKGTKSAKFLGKIF